VRRLLPAFLLVLAAVPETVSAQPDPGRMRFEWTTGYLNTGALGEVDFIFDSSGFGGPVVARDQGTLDVDPALWYGATATYRVNRKLSLAASWMHSEGRYRATFPALASIEGVLDLEGYILAVQDFAFQQNPDQKPSSAMSKALSDLFMVSASYEFEALNGWMSPFFTVGAGLFTQRSADRVISLEFGSVVPENVQTSENLGVDPLSSFGLSSFVIDDTNPAVSIGGGLRVAISERWAVHAQVEDLIRLGADLTYIDDTSTPEPDILTGRLFSTTFRGTEGSIHNFGVRLGIDYAIWPFSRPR
jgi:opacity protein-like surface antigen